MGHSSIRRYTSVLLCTFAHFYVTMRILEKGLVLLAVIGIALRLMLMHGSMLLLTMSAVGLALVYIFFSFALFNGIRFRDLIKRTSYIGVSATHIIGAILTGFTLAHACVALLFCLNLWPGAKVLLLMAIIPQMAILVLSMIKSRGAHREFYRRILTRAATILGLCIVLFLLPQKTLIKVLFRNKPALIDAVNQTIDNPGDSVLDQKMYEELNKQ